MMNRRFSSNLHLTTIDGERQLSMDVQTDVAGRRSVLCDRHARMRCAYLT
jgi:hypothetical protein